MRPASGAHRRYHGGSEALRYGERSDERGTDTGTDLDQYYDTATDPNADSWMGRAAEDGYRTRRCHRRRCHRRGCSDAGALHYGPCVPLRR